MREYHIALPMLSNSGADYAVERRRFELACDDIAGGFTRDGVPAHGEWKDPASGKIYAEAMQGYRVACDLEAWARLLDIAWGLFPDQLALYTADAGTVSIISRPTQKE